MNRIDDEYRPTANPNLTTTRVENDLVVLNEEREQVHKLNESAAFVFEMCRSGYTIGRIKADFSARYDAEQKVVERDLKSLLESFFSLDLIS